MAFLKLGFLKFRVLKHNFLSKICPLNPFDFAIISVWNKNKNSTI